MTVSMTAATTQRIHTGSLIAILASSLAMAFALWGGGLRAGQAIGVAAEAKYIACKADDRSHVNAATLREIAANQRNIEKLMEKIERKLP